MRVLGRAAALAALLLTLLAGAAHAQVVTTHDPPLTDDDYFAFADHVTQAMESSWKPNEGMYVTGARSIDTIANAAMLTVFATAAAHGHIGPARNDERARLLVHKLTAAPPFWTAAKSPHYDKMFHSPGWTSNMTGPYVDMDKSIDPKVAEGLQIAFRANDVLHLDSSDLAAIQIEVHAVSHVPFFRYPLVRLNQINWNSELYAYDWLVNGDPTLLREDYRKHVHRFVAGFKKPWTKQGATNVGPSYRFIYQNNSSPLLSRNLDSAEYSNMTLHFLYWYDSAIQAGMKPLGHEDLRLLRGWVQRDLYGYWTHAGFMNWDTGWSYDRWMKGKAWAYAQQGLLAIATEPTFTLRQDEPQYAKYLFDEGLQLYDRMGQEQGPKRAWRPSAELYGIGDQGAPASKMFWARMAANAVRAVSAGLGRMPSKRPPSFYAFDADIGRLAVSSPRYSTAVLAVNRGKVPYGGTELARLYDADGDPIGGTGGRPPSAFGVMVSRLDGRTTFATQVGLHTDPRSAPIVLTRSPRGRVDRVRRLATKPDAGPFKVLTERGSKGGDGVRVTTTNEFHRNSIRSSWTISRRSGAGTRRVRVMFPTSGGNAAVIEAHLRNGKAVRLHQGSHVALRGVRRFVLRSAHGSYVVDLRGDPSGQTSVFRRVKQKANPTGGPTLALELPRLRRGTRQLSVDIVPSSGGGTKGF